MKWRTTPQQLVSLIATCALGMLLGSTAAAQDVYPGSRSVTIIVPFAAGGGTDLATRAVARSMGQQLGASFVIDNRPGGNGFIGAQAAARAAPDGYTLFMTSLTTHSINPHLFRQLPYRLEDFVPVGFLAATSPVLLTAAMNDAKTLDEVRAQGVARGTQGLDFAVPNASSRFASAMFGLRSGIHISEVNYQSTPQAHLEVAAGRVDYVFGDFSAGAGLIESKKLRPIAVASPHRLSSQPDIPTMAEAGLPGVEVAIWSGLFAPRGTPSAVVESINRALNQALQEPEVREIFRKGAQDSRTMTPKEFGSYVEAQYHLWGDMARQLGIEAQ